MLITRLCDATDRSHCACNHYNRPPSRTQSPRMSEKQSLPSTLEPEWQGQNSNLLHLKAYPYQRQPVDTRNCPDRGRTKATTYIRHQVQDQEFKGESLAHDYMSSIGNTTLQRSRPALSLYGTRPTGLKLLDTISRDDLEPEAFPYPRLPEASNLYTSQGGQTPGNELSQAGRDSEEQSMCQDAGFDVAEEDVYGIDQDSHCHRQAVAERFAARFTVRHKTKRFRYSHGPRTRVHKIKVLSRSKF